MRLASYYVCTACSTGRSGLRFTHPVLLDLQPRAGARLKKMQKTPIRRAVVVLHIVDRSDLIWIPPLVQRIKVEAYTKDRGFELVSWSRFCPMASRAQKTPPSSTELFKCSRTGRRRSFYRSS